MSSLWFARLFVHSCHLLFFEWEIVKYILKTSCKSERSTLSSPLSKRLWSWADKPLCSGFWRRGVSCLQVVSLAPVPWLGEGASRPLYLQGAELLSRLLVFGWTNPQQSQSSHFPYSFLVLFSSDLWWYLFLNSLCSSSILFYFTSIIDKERVKVGADRTILFRDQLCSSRISSILFKVLLHL